MTNNSPDYRLRPSKHVERHLFIETLQNIRKVGYDFTKYHYVGFGSYFYVDCILFNKYLSIKKVTSLENKSNREKRVKFNKPYPFIEVKITSATDYIPTLKTGKPYIVWLDYECPLNGEILSDIGTLISTLKNGSILIVTVNASVRLANSRSLEYIPNAEISKFRTLQQQKLVEKYEQELDPYCGAIKKSDITPNSIKPLLTKAIQNKISDSLRGRLGDAFFQLFNYYYRDGSEMLTFGGIIEAEDQEGKIYESVQALEYINKDISPTKISIPTLTSREKFWIDKNLDKVAKDPTKIPFELDPDAVLDYVKFSKYHPSYHEVFMN